jgi:hypothetical protein
MNKSLARMYFSFVIVWLSRYLASSARLDVIIDADRWPPVTSRILCKRFAVFMHFRKPQYQTLLERICNGVFSLLIVKMKGLMSDGKFGARGPENVVL